MISSTDKLHEFISPSTTTKQMYEMYQQALGVDLWSSHFEAMQENLKKLMEVNMKHSARDREEDGRKLERDEDRGTLMCLSIPKEFLSLLDALMPLPPVDQQYKAIAGQIDTSKKKWRNADTIHKGLVQKPMLQRRTT
ncbi:hypothetical protein MLD38_034985 [Melastoma candidum]|uniref:Uncharacterized protein n=1 Tax=Melastoma candidum TaxID=119954 RepID=A0ACB9MC84_9MYRT|nr:hypothetical protein MLD38_034985 [Melastoma candidum]